MIPLPEQGAKNHTPARSRHSGKAMVTLRSQRDEHAVNQQVTGSMAVGIAGRIRGEIDAGPARTCQGGWLGATAVSTPAYAVGAGTRCRMLRVKKRHGKMELRSLTHFAIDPQAPAMHLDEMFGNGQTETCASGFAGAGDINAIKAFKNARLVSLWNADTGV